MRNDRSILLQFTSNNKDAIAFTTRCQLLNTGHTFEPLNRPAVREDDVDFETVTNLGVYSVNEAIRWIRTTFEAKYTPRCGVLSRP